MEAGREAWKRPEPKGDGRDSEGAGRNRGQRHAADAVGERNGPAPPGVHTLTRSGRAAGRRPGKRLTIRDS